MFDARVLGNILVRHGVVTPEVLEPLFQQQREKGVPLTELLIQAHAASEADVARALANECGLPFVERLDVASVPTAIAARLPIGYCKAHKLLVTGEDDEVVYALAADPLDTAGIDDIRASFGKPVRVTVATP